MLLGVASPETARRTISSCHGAVNCRPQASLAQRRKIGGEARAGAKISAAHSTFVNFMGVGTFIVAAHLCRRAGPQTLGVYDGCEEEDDHQEAREEGREEGRSGAQAFRQEDGEEGVVVVAAPAAPSF